MVCFVNTITFSTIHLPCQKNKMKQKNNQIEIEKIEEILSREDLSTIQKSYLKLYLKSLKEKNDK